MVYLFTAKYLFQVVHINSCTQYIICNKNKITMYNVSVAPSCKLLFVLGNWPYIFRPNLKTFPVSAKFFVDIGFLNLTWIFVKYNCAHVSRLVNCSI